jgi:mannose-6-phosphate isomerase-like protein (cupin superfamily)
MHVLDETATFKVDARDVAGAFSLVELQTPPGGGAPSHVHESSDKVLYIVEGVYRLEVDGRAMELYAGGCALVPRGTRFAYTNSGSERARLLVISSPAASRESVFVELAALFAAGPQGSPELADALEVVAAARGVELRPDSDTDSDTEGTPRGGAAG